MILFESVWKFPEGFPSRWKMITDPFSFSVRSFFLSNAPILGRCRRFRILSYSFQDSLRILFFFFGIVCVFLFLSGNEGSKANGKFFFIWPIQITSGFLETVWVSLGFFWEVADVDRDHDWIGRAVKGEEDGGELGWKWIFRFLSGLFFFLFFFLFCFVPFIGFKGHCAT